MLVNVARRGAPHDRNAVMVFSERGHLGYLPRDVAAEYRRLFAEIRKRGYHGEACVGILTGSAAVIDTAGEVVEQLERLAAVESLSL